VLFVLAAVCAFGIYLMRQVVIPPIGCHYDCPPPEAFLSLITLKELAYFAGGWSCVFGLLSLSRPGIQPDYTELIEQFRYLAREVYGIKLAEFYRLTADELRLRAQQGLQKKTDEQLALETKLSEELSHVSFEEIRECGKKIAKKGKDSLRNLEESLRTCGLID